jgi:NADPH-dependent ferric siderophore reductase
VSADEPYEEGEQMAEIALEDQHGVTGAIDADTRQVLFTRDMDAGDVVKAALAQNGAALLAASGTVYVADISGMPSLVRHLFALPKMRKRGYSMLLDVDGEATRRIPGKSGSATLISLNGLKITSFRYLAETDELKAALGVSE